MNSSIKTDIPLILDQNRITSRIAKFWDTISAGLNEVWGPHIHHGYYENKEPITPLEAQIRLIEKIASLIKVRHGDKILDAGCGLGGSSLHLAEKFGANVSGITLSKVQVDIAERKAYDAGARNVSFSVEDALSMHSFTNESFDIVWSLESCEQFFDKPRFVAQAKRVLKKNGTLVLATWCSSQDKYEGAEARAYKKLCLSFDLPYMPTQGYYQRILKSAGLDVEKTLDLTPNVEKSWDIGISLVNAWSFLQILRKSGLRGFIFTKQLKLMQKAYRDTMLNYMVFVAHKR
jgi:tocopherol O-methyltransferase